MFELKDVYILLGVAAVLIANYYALLRSLDRKLDKQDYRDDQKEFREKIERSLDEVKTQTEAKVSAVRKDIADGIAKLLELNQKVSEKAIEYGVRLKILEKDQRD